MNIFSHLLHPGTTPTPDGRTEPKEPEVILPYHNENTAEGGEFLDDAIRMEDVPSAPEA
ncbi:hypothetical protein QFZ51_004898 [Chitinophaga sp. W3I9]|uniref:hypothetical protein n=1 Tax=unclassified Chitinophaga TaxID=2619133 RepID=UPI003D223DEF